MQTTLRKTETKSKGKEKTSKDDATPLSKKPLDEKLKRSVFSVSTPRNYIQKSTTADIYAQKKNNATEVAKAPKKVVGTTNQSSRESPMKNLLKSSSSSVSQVSATKARSSPQIKTEAKVVNSARRETPRKNKDLPLLNVTVNSPIPKKRLENRDDDKRAANAEARTLKKEDGRKSSKNTDKRKETIKDTGRKSTNKEEARKTKEKSLVTKDVPKKSFDADTKEFEERHRTKTRTLNDNEVKVLTPDAVDNNAEMLNLSKRLSAKPKAFFVDLDDATKAKLQKTEKSSEDEVEYEDDFESYESDFDSYHGSSHSDEKSVDDISDDRSTSEQENESINDVDSNKEQRGNVEVESGMKEGKDEEKMLDSGNFDLRDSRSANKFKTGTMGHIQEDSEMDVRSSLTDEGFQDMSSAGCSIRTVHSDVLERPIFKDFTKSKENKRKRKIFEKLKQRAIDILSMVTLHEMSYSLFEMKPIPYDLYMATFGRSNYIQTAAQTFDDGLNVEVQTEEIICEDKWTQHPVEFSNHDIYLKQTSKSRKYSHHTADYLTKFTFLIAKNTNPDINNMINSDDDYKSNPLRMYFEQKDGVGPAEMLPYANYKNKLKNNDFNIGKLTKFLKKRESRITSILSANSGNSKGTDLVKSTKYPFSKGYVSISTKTMAEEKYPFLKQIKVTGVIFSETKSNLILTVHKNCTALDEKCVICLWDMSVLKKDPIKMLIAIDNVNIGRFKGSTNGIFVGALDDGSVHLWDMSEEPTWYSDVASKKKSDLIEVETRAMTQLENDREWNLKNSHVVYESTAPQFALQACAFTSSAIHMLNGDSTDSIVGLEVETKSSHSQDGGRKLLGQVCTLQRIGILAIWSIIQEKMKSTPDMGKAYWSKIKLELNQTISLIEHIDLPVTSSMENIFVQSFNMNAAKRRTSLRRKDKSLKKHLSRQKSTVKPDSSRPASAASVKNTFIPQNNWECGLVCNDLKIMRLDSRDNYLVARNCGEVLCCTRSAGIFKINRFCVATDTSSVTSIDVSPHSLPYFLAATDSGTVNLCSLLEARVLLTLDCRNGPPTSETEKYYTDLKGRFLGASVRPQSAGPVRPISSIAVKSVRWSPVNACCIFALLSGGALMSWDLTHSDIYAKHSSERAAEAWSASDNSLALLSPEGEVQVHMLTEAQHTRAHQQLFQKYIALL